MPVNAIITLSLIAALTIVLLKRRSLASSQTAASARIARRVTKLRNNSCAHAEKAPRRMRPRLALIVSGLPSEEEIRSAGNPPPPGVKVDDDDGPAASAQPEVPEVPWAVPEPQHTVGGTHEGDHATLLANSGPVDAPGWPSPGELAGRDRLEGVAPVPPGHGSEEGALDTVIVNEESNATTLVSPYRWTDSGDRRAFATQDTQLPYWNHAPETEVSSDAVATLTPLTTADATVWDDVEWEGQSSDEPDTSSAKNAPDASESLWMPDDALDPAEPTVAHAGPTERVIDESLLTAPADPAASRYPLTDHDRAIASAVRPFIATAAEAGAPTPVIVVVVPETRSHQTKRDDELTRAIRRLEKRFVALTDAKPTRAQQRSRAMRQTRATPKSGLSLTKVEERSLRALAARRSAPIAVRRRTRILLGTAAGLDVAAIALRVGTHPSTVRRWQMRFADQRLAALGDIRAPKR